MLTFYARLTADPLRSVTYNSLAMQAEVSLGGANSSEETVAAIRQSRWITWRQVAGRTWSKLMDEDATGRAAELAYYFFLAIFPLLICVLQIFAIFPSAAERLRVILLQFVGRVLPYQRQP